MRVMTTQIAVKGKIEFCGDMRERSGEVTCRDGLMSFFYELMRDHVPPGVVEGIVTRSDPRVEVKYTNGWLANYARDISARLTEGQVEGFVLGSTCPDCSGDGNRRGVIIPCPETGEDEWPLCELCGGEGRIPDLEYLRTMQVDRSSLFDKIRALETKNLELRDQLRKSERRVVQLEQFVEGVKEDIGKE